MQYLFPYKIFTVRMFLIANYIFLSSYLLGKTSEWVSLYVQRLCPYSDSLCLALGVSLRCWTAFQLGWILLRLALANIVKSAVNTFILFLFLLFYHLINLTLFFFCLFFMKDKIRSMYLLCYDLNDHIFVQDLFSYIYSFHCPHSLLSSCLLRPLTDLLLIFIRS